MHTRVAARLAGGQSSGPDHSGGWPGDGDISISLAADGFQEASSGGLPVGSGAVMPAGPVACEGRRGPAEEVLDRSRYNCLDSPFLDLHSPFTAWCEPQHVQMP